MDNSGYNHADLGEFQKQLSDMVVTYQQLPEGEQPAAFHLLQASLGPLLTIPADYGLADQQSGHHLIITDHQHIAGVAQQHAAVHQEQLSAAQDQHMTVDQEPMITDQDQKITDHDYGTEDLDDLKIEPDHLTLEQDQLTGKQDSLAETARPMTEGERHQHDSDSLTITKEVTMVSREAYPAAAAAEAGAAPTPQQQLSDGAVQQQWDHADLAASPTQENDSAAAAAATGAAGKKPARRPDAERYVCPVPSCGRPCGHRKALVLHVKWEHMEAPVCCRACRTELNSHAHFLYHKRTCFQGVSALVCPDCGARFTMELPYKRHLAGHALNACHKCGERLSSRKALVKHLRHEHKIRECEKWFACDKCPKRFMKKRSWLTHTKVHATKDDVQCGRCGLTISEQRLADHIKTEHSHEPHTCTTCHKRFRRNQQYLQHMRLHEQYDCSLCGQPFVTQSEYAAHMQSQHQVQPELLNGPALSRHRCEVCGVTFWSHAQLSEHLAKHPDASLECSRCQTEFESASHLHRHLRRSLCSRSPQLICHHCGAQFCAHFALRKHLARAHGEGSGAPTRCPHCDYTNSSPANLRRHIAAHQQLARRYVCDQCAAAFHTLSTLKDHQLYVHTTEKRFTCAECQKAFKTSSSLNRHLRVHSETRPYECYCGNSYKRMSHLRRHMTAVHNVRTRTRLIERLDGSAAGSSDSGSDAAGSTGGGGSEGGGGGGRGGGGESGGGGGSGGSGGSGDSGGAESGGGTEPAASEPSDWAGLVSEQGVTYITDDGLLRVYPLGEGEELPEFTLPQGVYSTDTVLLPDGSRSIVLKPAGELGGQLEAGGGGGGGGGTELVAEAGREPTATLPPPSTIRSSQQRLV